MNTNYPMKTFSLLRSPTSKNSLEASKVTGFCTSSSFWDLTISLHPTFGRGEQRERVSCVWKGRGGLHSKARKQLVFLIHLFSALQYKLYFLCSPAESQFFPANKANTCIIFLTSHIKDTTQLQAAETKQAGLCSFIAKAARVKMQQHSSDGHTDILGRKGGSWGGTHCPLSPRQQLSYFLPAAWHRIANEHSDSSHSYC